MLKQTKDSLDARQKSIKQKVPARFVINVYQHIDDNIYMERTTVLTI